LSNTFEWYTIGEERADWYSSQSTKISHTKDDLPATGDTFTICGNVRAIGTLPEVELLSRNCIKRNENWQLPGPNI